jgi:predicted SPOUT superfamily RNA methylase MTH1
MNENCHQSKKKKVEAQRVLRSTNDWNATAGQRESRIVTMDGLTHDTRKNHQQRKLEAKLQKRQKIEQSGGIRPRSNPSSTTSTTSTTKSKPNSNHHRNESPLRNESSYRASNRSNERNTNTVTQNQQHRFGRVMEHVPCRNVSRFSTLSIAIPSSIISNCQTRELKTILCGQIARAATIYHVDEIIIYNDNCNSQHNDNNNYFRHRVNHDKHNNKRSHDDHSKAETTKEDDDNTTDSPSKDIKTNDRNTSTHSNGTTDPQLFMARILQYCECPQYLRKHFFPLHIDLQFTGLLAPIDAPHHVRADDRCQYREGVVLNKSTPNNIVGSYVNCGIKNRPVL